MFLMGCKGNFCIVVCNCIIFSLYFSSFEIAHGSTSYDSSSLDESIRSFAEKTLMGKRTGEFLNVSLPANFSDIEASVIRLRSRSLWQNGLNFTSFYIPSMVLPFPFVKRLAIVCQNLGNWSDYYYKVPGYSLAAPVVGFMAYHNTNLGILGNETRLNVLGDLITVRFSEFNTKVGNISELKCVQFGENGLIEFRNLTEESTCQTQSNGHFAIVFPSPESSEKKRSIWWLIVLVTSAGLILVVIILVNFYKIAGSKKISKMESESDKGLPFDMRWVGSSKLPSASMVRTQPVLEQEDIP